MFTTQNPFLTYFWPKTVRKHFKNRDKPINYLKKLKNHPKNQNKKSNEAHIYFFKDFQGKKKPNINSPDQMKLFDSNIDCFSGLNQY
jgi:hypothetical protein